MVIILPLSLPESLVPGEYHLTQGVNSKCPSMRETILSRVALSIATLSEKKVLIKSPYFQNFDFPEFCFLSKDPLVLKKKVIKSPVCA